MSIQRYAVVAFVFSTLIAGCSGGGSSPSSPSSTATPVPTATPTLKPTATPSPFATGPVTVNVSGSTNTQPYTIVLQQSATAVVTLNNGTPESPVPVPTTDSNRFFADLNTYSPIDDVTTYSPCVRSASFGTTTTLMYGGFTTGDVSCSSPTGSSPANTLSADALQIKKDIANVDPDAFGNFGS